MEGTHFVWVKSHGGFPWNKAVDYEASIGCYSSETLRGFKSTAKPITLYEFSSQELITQKGWTSRVERRARQVEGGVQ